MADKPLGRDYFPIVRETGEIVSGVKQTSTVGYFSTIQSTSRFLGIQGVAASDATLTFTKRKASKKTATRMDGTITTASSADKNAGGTTTDISIEASEVLQSSGGRGSKTVRLKSGKPIVAGQTRTFTCSFRFPGFCTNLIISNALGDLIPAAKIAASGTVVSEEQLYPFFLSAGGKRYPIAAQSAAKADTAEVEVPNSAAELAAALAANKGSEKAN